MSETIVITVRVKPRSQVSELVHDATGAWVARLKSPPVDGKANAELIALVAKQFECPRTAVSITSGTSARMKLIKILR